MINRTDLSSSDSHAILTINEYVYTPTYFTSTKHDTTETVSDRYSN